MIGIGRVACGERIDDVIGQFEHLGNEDPLLKRLRQATCDCGVPVLEGFASSLVVWKDLGSRFDEVHAAVPGLGKIKIQDAAEASVLGDQELSR